MCQMTTYGTRWRRTIELPGFGESETWWAILHKGELRYMRAPHLRVGEDYWFKPLYLIRIERMPRHHGTKRAA